MTDFDIHETQDGEWRRLRLTGELDLGSAPLLKHRLDELRAQGEPVRLDLSGLHFIDSSGMHLLVGAVTDGHNDAWKLDVDPWLAPNVEQSLRLAKLERMLRPAP
jgi:anti-anti-sigma factor